MTPHAAAYLCEGVELTVRDLAQYDEAAELDPEPPAEGDDVAQEQ